MFFSRLASLSLLASAALGKILFAGVNESGGEFGVFSSVKGTGLPGVFGQDFQFINQDTVQTFVQQEGINLFRVTFLLERMCPVDQGTGKGLGATFDENYFNEFQDAINFITKDQGVFALLDAHNYMRYNDPSNQPFSGSIIGDTSDPQSASVQDFQDFWQEFASRFVDNPNVLFGIMNEPHDMPTQLILDLDQAAINGIRAAGAKQLITAPGNGFTGAHSWSSGNDPSSALMFKLVDPLNNTAFEVHEYFDQDFSGTHDSCVNAGPENIQNFVDFLNQFGFKGLLGEFGGGQNANCQQFIDDTLKFVNSQDAFIGWTAWAAGPLWGTAAACCGADTGNLEPGTLNDKGQDGAFATNFVKAIRPNIPNTLVKTAPPNLNF